MKPNRQPHQKYRTHEMRDQNNNPSHPPLATSAVSAGFPSPADDYLDEALDLNELLIAHPAATFFVRARGDSMNGADSAINDGDLLIVDRSREARNGAIVIAIIDGELTVKRLRRTGAQIELLATNPAYPPIRFALNDHKNNDHKNSATNATSAANETTDSLCEIWGVVTCVIHQL